MKSKEVMRLLRISRSTLSNYVKSGIIKADKLPNGKLEYDERSVSKLMSKRFFNFQDRLEKYRRNKIIAKII